MTRLLPKAWGVVEASAVIRSCPEDFQVRENLGFALSGEGEHVFLYLEKRRLNTMDVAGRLARVAGVRPGDIGYSGLKDRNALTSQWFSVGLAGRSEPDWSVLEAEGDLRISDRGRHRRKLKRGVHRSNRFVLALRGLRGDRSALEQRLALVQQEGVPNYFGEQRFGRNGATLEQAERWMVNGGGRVSRLKRSLYLSALRAGLFNRCLAQRVNDKSWNRVSLGDVCMLHGTRSYFECTEVDEDIKARIAQSDIHPASPLWGRGGQGCPAGSESTCEFLEKRGLKLDWRANRLVPDDFCWRFCDDGSLLLEFTLGAGSYATALLAELVHYKEERNTGSDTGSE